MRPSCLLPATIIALLQSMGDAAQSEQNKISKGAKNAPLEFNIGDQHRPATELQKKSVKESNSPQASSSIDDMKYWLYHQHK